MNENEFKNYYQILGIDKSLIDYVIYDKKKDGKYVPKLIDRLTVNVDGDYVSIKDDKEDVTYIFDEYGILTSIKK